jgi:hypothetical protein
MKKLWKRSAAVTLLLSAALFFNAMGGVAMASDSEVTAVKAVAAVSVGVFDDFFMHSNVHQQAYLTYLVREYAPESEADWKEAFAQRNKAAEEMKEKIETVTLENNPELKVKTEAALDVSVVFDEEAAKNMKIAKRPALDDKQLQEIKAEMELQEEFARAVEAGDADAIREVLPSLLENYKDKTARLPEMAGNIEIRISEGADAAGE